MVLTGVSHKSGFFILMFGACAGTVGTAGAGWEPLSPYGSHGLPHSMVVSEKSDFLHGCWLFLDGVFQKPRKKLHGYL